MDEEIIELCRSGYKNKKRVKCVDTIPTDDDGYVLDEVIGAMPDVRNLPRKGGCGIGPNGSSFEQVLDKLDRRELQRREAKIAAEKKALEERLAQEEAEVSRLRSLSEKELLVEICLLLKGPQLKKKEKESCSLKKKFDYDKWQEYTDAFKEEQQILCGIK